MSRAQRVISGATAIAVGALALAAAVPARAEDRPLVLAITARQSTGDVDFSLPPRWRAPVKCAVLDTRDSCLLEKMTSEPEGVPPSEIVGKALRLAALFDARRKVDDSDGLMSLRASETYLIAGAYELKGSHLAEARTYFELALARAREVPPRISRFVQVAANYTAPLPTNNTARTSQPRVPLVMSMQEERNIFYPLAELVREYAVRALATKHE